LNAVADKGYYKGEELHACEQAGIVVYVPKPRTSPNKAKGLYDRCRFKYIRRADAYRCPAGERLTHRMTTTEQGKTLKRYWTSACSGCALRAQCTTGKERRISRWDHEDVLERAEARLKKRPEMMLARRSLVEHPFGTLKSWTSSAHLLTRTLPRVRTEISLQILAYNMKRAINLVGPQKIMDTIRA
jgi:hypothetical protein